MAEEKVQEEVNEELSAEEIAAAEVAKAEESVEAKVAEEVKEKTWEELGLDPRYDSIDRAQIAGEIKQRNVAFGNQTLELGDTRKENAALKEQIANFKKAADLPVEVKAEVKKMSEAELGRWLEDLQTDPRTAIQGLLGDKFGRRSDDELNELMDKRINEGLQGYDGYREDQKAMADSDYQLCSGYIETLREERHFGNTRATMELLELARLVLTDKASADAVYETMKRFPGVPMKDCIHMINGRPKSKVDPEKIRKQVKGLAGGGLPSGSQKVSSTEKIEDMHSAFHPDEE